MLRCFLAVPVPEEVKEALKELQELLKETGAKVRWVRPEGIHLTLKFFGNIPEEKLPVLVRAAEKAKKETPPFELTLEGLGFFPFQGTPRVIWVGLEGQTEPLLRLQEKLEKAFKKAGFPREKRAFHPHLTLGRVKDPQGAGALRKKAETLKVPPLSFEVDRLVFYQSVLHREGALYTPLKEVFLEA